MATLITGIDAGRVRENLARVRERAARATSQVLAAVKYVPLEELGTLAEAGIELAGENRAQDLEAKADGAPGRSAGTSSASSRAARSSRSSRTSS